MLVRDWMTREVTHLTQDRSMMKASKLMKDQKISRIPIVDDNMKVVGIVTDRDVKEASPSKATTLDMHELYYLLSEIKLKDIMTRTPRCLHEEDTIEMAAAIFKNNKFGGMPVVDDENKLVGVITDTDIFDVLVSITGVMEGGVSIGFRLSNEPGGLVPVLDFLKNKSARVMSLLTSCAPPEEGMRDVFIRIRDMEKSELKKLRAALEEEFEVVHWVRDNVDPVV
ncbi:MAG: CBS and ACT domain-containing protein [Desulfovibrio sp.]